MSKKMLCLLALVALVAFGTFSFAAGVKTPATAVQHAAQSKLLPPDIQCGNCFAYGGDIDPNDPNANGLASEKDISVTDAEVVQAMDIPTGGSATVVRVVGNFLTIGCSGGLDPKQADWDIRQGVSSGNGGTVVASGTDKAIIGSTGRTAFGLTECHVETKLSNPVALSSGTYFIGLVPYCTNGGNGLCAAGQRFFLSDTTSSTNGRGFVETDNSFFNSSFFGTNWQETWGPNGACGGIGCDKFSSGLIGPIQRP